MRRETNSAITLFLGKSGFQLHGNRYKLIIGKVHRRGREARSAVCKYTSGTSLQIFSDDHCSTFNLKSENLTSRKVYTTDLGFSEQERATLDFNRVERRCLSF